MLISEGVDGSPQPYVNLLPIVEALTDSGNAVLDGGFRLDPDGWRCRMASPLDFDLISRLFALPASIVASPETDTVLDRSTWVSVEGPGAASLR